eukprot:TRINITY_DN31092_c0_g2_i1.p1 TRINITY_DN31092_c0_g2~~TRINITY_DN31092_c0_g2_i1.p1  ORF type:complete len:2358 (+),score=467.67 TRINITY_DN31092_c0_g2_i1:1061-7075(+)
MDDLTPAEKEESVVKKRAMIAPLLFGMEKSREFKQWWMVTNGLAHWWNLFLELVETSHHDPKLLSRTLQEYRDGLKEMQKYLFGPPEFQVPLADLDQPLAARLILAHVEASVAAGQLDALDVEQLLPLKRLGFDERKLVMARVAVLCKANDRPLPDVGRLRPERLEAAGGPSAPAPKKGAAPPPPTSSDASDLLGNEAEIMQQVASIAYEKDPDSAKKCVDRALELLNAWEPRANDEFMLTLWAEVWTRLGRQCLCGKMLPELGRKYALMCCIKCLGNLNAPMPKYASVERLRWRGACHALSGEVFGLLVDTHKQEKESLEKLRTMSVEQFKLCCEYASRTKNDKLADFGARSLWNVALPLLHSGQTRQLLIEPLRTATRALGCVKNSDDPFFFVGLYQALFDCYSDGAQWEMIHEMLNEAFPVVPPEGARRLWSMRMLALSRQGKNVVIAMSKMKESKAKAEAGIWLVLAQASSKRVDQLNAYNNAIRLLQSAEQTDVVEVRMEFADWLLRNGFSLVDAQEHLAAAADMLLEVEEAQESEDEEEGGADDVDPSAEGGLSRDSGSQGGRSKGSRHSSTRRSSLRRNSCSDVSRHSKRSQSSGTRKSRRKSGSRSRSRSSSRSAAAKKNKQKKTDEDENATEQLYSHHQDALFRIYAMRTRLSAGPQLYDCVMASAYFAARFFACTVDMANAVAQVLADEAQGPEGAEATEGKHRATAGIGAANATKQPQRQPILPPFAAPLRISDWAFEERWQWRHSSGAAAALAEILAKGQEAEIIPRESVSWIGHEDAFVKPALTFFAVCQLERDLEEHGYHLWIFPVLALHLQLADCFPEGQLRDAVVCLAQMRRARHALQCRLLAASAAAADKWMELLPRLTEDFSSFEDELENVRSRRSGCANAGDSLDADMLPAPAEERGVEISAPWSCADLHAYEVWAELAAECFLQGELFAAASLTKEAITHARVYGDRRTLRRLHLLKARLSYEEGHYAEAIRAIREISAAELPQTVEAACLLADIYLSTRQLVLASNVLEDATKAIESSPEASACKDLAAEERAASLVLGLCNVRRAKVSVELARLAAMTGSTRSWFQGLDGIFKLHEQTQAGLISGTFHLHNLVQCVEFAGAIERLLETKRLELMRDTALSIEKGGVLSFDILANYANRLCESVTNCIGARDELLYRVVPTDGTEEGVVSPAQALCSRFDVWHTRVLTLRRKIKVTKEVDRVRDVATASYGQGRFFSHRAPDGVVTGPVGGAAVVQGADVVKAWEREIDDKINEAKRERNDPRQLSEVESSIALLSNAVTVLRAFAERPENAEAASARELPLCRTEALLELGRLELEIAGSRWDLGRLQPSPPGAVDKWETKGADPRELLCMEVGERCSNTLMGKDPHEIYKQIVPPEETETPSTATIQDSDGQHPLAYDEKGKVALCDAAAAAIGARQFEAAHRAFLSLALDAYGVSCPEASFEFLLWLQSVDVCITAQESFDDLLPHNHSEVVQQRLLRRLEKAWVVPQVVGSYRTVVQRLQRESPWFQKTQLSELPSVSDLLLSYVPPKTLVVTLQVHEHYLYVGATCTPQEGADQSVRLAQLRPFVSRFVLWESELLSCTRRLNELNLAIEKDLITSPYLSSEALQIEYGEILKEAEMIIGLPIAKALGNIFWKHGLNVEHVGNPQQMIILPDRALWSLPLERFDCLLRLCGFKNKGAISRDLSLHLAAQRVARVVEDPAGGDRKPLQARVPTARPESTVLFTDTFNEDTMLPNDSAASELLCAVHKRLVEAKIIGNAALSTHGEQLTVSPGDIKVALADSTALLALGFGQFMNIVGSTTFAAQDLRHLALIALFQRSINYDAFRRQTKADSAKTLRQLALQSPFGVALVSGFRGVQCLLMAIAPVPTPIGARACEVFARGLQGGKTVAKAFEDVLNGEIADPALRYARTVEGGLLPGGAPLLANLQAIDPKAKAPAAAAPKEGETLHEWLPFHTQTAYTLIGVPWIVAESDGSAGKKK